MQERFFVFLRENTEKKEVFSIKLEGFSIQPLAKQYSVKSRFGFKNKPNLTPNQLIDLFRSMIKEEIRQTFSEQDEYDEVGKL